MVTLKKLMIFLTIVFTLPGCTGKGDNNRSASSMTVISSPSTPIFYTSTYDDKTLKELGITLNST